MEDIKVSALPKKKNGFRKFMLWFILILFLMIGTYAYWKYFFTYSDGNRTGLLQKLSRKGTVFKTYEGELVLSSISSTGGVAIASEKFYFSVVDKAVAKKMEAFEGKQVKLHYLQKNGILPWRGESVYIVNEVISNQ